MATEELLVSTGDEPDPEEALKSVFGQVDKLEKSYTDVQSKLPEIVKGLNVLAVMASNMGSAVSTHDLMLGAMIELLVEKNAFTVSALQDKMEKLGEKVREQVEKQKASIVSPSGEEVSKVEASKTE